MEDIPKPQAKIGKNLRLYVSKRDLLNYVHDIQDVMRFDGLKADFSLTKAIDGSLIFLINGEIVGREHPGVPEIGPLDVGEENEFLSQYVDDEGRPVLPSPEKRQIRPAAKPKPKSRNKSKKSKKLKKYKNNSDK